MITLKKKSVLGIIIAGLLMVMPTNIAVAESSKAKEIRWSWWTGLTAAATWLVAGGTQSEYPWSTAYYIIPAITSAAFCYQGMRLYEEESSKEDNNREKLSPWFIGFGAAATIGAACLMFQFIPNFPYHLQKEIIKSFSHKK